jgi:hypothetical protein
LAYDAAVAQPVLKIPRLGTLDSALWTYVSADVHTDVDASGYFTNGDALGMKVNDTVIVTKNTATVGATLHTVTAVTANGAATVSAAILA